MQFTMYLSNILNFRIEGLDLFDNVYKLPQELIDCKLKSRNASGNVLYFDCDFKCVFTPEVVKQNTTLIELFQHNSTIYRSDFSAKSLDSYQTKEQCQEYLKLFLLDNQQLNPFKWVLAYNNVLSAVSEDNIEVALKSIEYWNKVEKTFVAKSELLQAEKDLDTKKRIFNSSSIPTVQMLTIEEDEYDDDYYESDDED
jgi:hypothetical protein